MEEINLSFKGSFSKLSDTVGSSSHLSEVVQTKLLSPFNYLCEFSNCLHNSFENYGKFRNHGETHFSQISIDNGKLICDWKLCSFSTSDSKEFSRHFYFHFFHTKLKSEGLKALNQRPSVKPCELNSEEVNIIPDLADDFFCLWANCNTPPFEDAQLFYWHVQNHGNSNELSFKCEWNGCSSRPKTSFKLKDHLKSHSQEKTVACPKCGNLFATKTKFYDHCCRQVPPEDKLFECYYCSKRFGVERLLRIHIRSHINTVKCPFCALTAASNSNLRNHIKYRHSELKQHECSECEYSAKSSYDLGIHVSRVHGSTTRKCTYPECDYTGDTWFQLKAHKTAFHSEKPHPYRCHRCSKKFKRGQYLSKHLKSVHNLSYMKGHNRFRYTKGTDGIYQLQTERFDLLNEEEDELNLF